MMTLDYVGNREAMVYAQLGQQPLARTTETSLEPRLGTLSYLSARPPDLDFWTGTRPGWWACPRALSRLYTPSARRRRSPRVRVIDNRSFCRRYGRRLEPAVEGGTTPRQAESWMSQTAKLPLRKHSKLCSLTRRRNYVV